MNDSTIAVRYAKALFESAKENNLLDEVREDMEIIQQICDISEFKFLLASPVIKESQKCKVLDEMLAKDVQQITLTLLHLLFRNGRELFIQAITRNFIDQYKKYKGIRTATLTGAIPVPEDLRSKIEKIVQKALNAPVELGADHNKDLIGGFLLRIDDLQYDASVAYSLKKVKKALLN